MAQFPVRQADLLKLTHLVAAGLDANPALYPAPPVTPANLLASLAAAKAALSEVTATYAAYKAALETKDQLMAEMADDLKSCLRYAEYTVKYDDDKLKLLGWAARRKGRRLQVPGQVMMLTAAEQGDDWVTLIWKVPEDGDKPAAFKVMRNEDDGKWLSIETALKGRAKLIEQPRLKELRYKVIAINNAGEGKASNTVKVVL